ncbi:MAG: hypothetical protein KJ072_23705 [Verrucomicrobia bacterium]|nr:hypothetical protein [Verrucomicrobiota bacterium]
MQRTIGNASTPSQGAKPGGSTRAGEPLVLDLRQAPDVPRRLVGGKTANLGRMLRAGLPVPSGFCVTTAAFGDFLASCSERDELRAGLRSRHAFAGDQPTFQLSQQAVPLLSESPMPPAVEAAVLKAWRESGEDGAYAVRSSATVKDTADHSFAGQFESFLNVRGRDALLAAIRKCWLSLFSERVLAYQAKNGRSPEQTAMAVIVQEMVPAEAAGVLFTVDPVGGKANRMIIEAVPGLGDRLVSGQVNPESLVLEKPSLRLLNRQATTAAPCLTDSMARKLGALALEVERLFGQPQDIEWAVHGDRVFLLQSRPVTALPLRNAQVSVDPGEPTDLWTNANVIEALPDVVTPMSWSLMQILLADFLYPLMRRLGLKVGPPPLIDLIAGRAYMNLSLVRGLVQRVGLVEIDIASAFGGQYDAAGQPPATGSFVPARLFNRQTLGFALRLSVWMAPGLFGQRRLIERWGRRVFDGPAHTPPSTLSDEQLAAFPATLLRAASRGEGERTWAAAAWMGACAAGGSTAVFQLARRWLDDHDGSIANRLLSGAGDMHSAENGLALSRLAAWVKRRPALAQTVLTPGSFAEVRRRLPGVEAGAEFLDRWREFLAKHGHQARGGMDPAQPRWSETPDLVLDVLRACLRVPDEADPVTLQGKRLRTRDRLLADCRRRLRNPLKRVVFLGLLRASQRGLRQRENVKNDGVRLVAILRGATLEAGRRLTARGGLREPAEVFLLKLEELKPALCGDAAFDLRAAIAERAAEEARQRKLHPPPVIVGRFDEEAPLPPASGLEATELNGVAVSPGVATGRARVILQADTSAHVLPGEILVAPYTDPGWTPCFLTAAAVVVDIGGLLSHGSVVAREYGLPAVVNVGPATRTIRTGDLLKVDGNRGRVTILARAPNP